MAIVSGVYLEPIASILGNAYAFDWDADTFSGPLIDSATPPTIDTSTGAGNLSDATPIYADLSAQVHASSGTYDPATSSVTVGTKSIVIGTAVAGRLDIIGAMTVWTGTTISAVSLLMYNNTLAAPVDPLFCSIDFGGTIASTAGSYTVTLDATGFIKWTMS